TTPRDESSSAFVSLAAALLFLRELHAAAEATLQPGLDDHGELTAGPRDPAGIGTEHDLRDERDARLLRAAGLDDEHAEDVADLDHRAEHPATIDLLLRGFDLLLVLRPRRGIDEVLVELLVPEHRPPVLRLAVHPLRVHAVERFEVQVEERVDVRHSEAFYGVYAQRMYRETEN